MKPYYPFPRGTRILVGVSGGLDSVALFHILMDHAAANDWTIGVGHIQHGLRGAASRADERFVRRLALAKGCRIHVLRATVPADALARGVSIEMAARDARRTAFARWMKRYGYTILALAHTLDDQAETVLLRVIRGTSVSGLGAMRRDAPWGNWRMVRPLLGIPRDTLRAYLLERGLEWQEDASNRDPAHFRNRVRLELLPLLKSRFNPRVRDALTRLAELVQWEDDLLREMAREDRVLCAGKRDGGLNVHALTALPLARHRRVITSWLHEQGVSPAEVRMELVDRIIRWNRRRGGRRRMVLRQGHCVYREDGCIFIDRHHDMECPVDARIRVRLPGTTRMPEFSVEVETAWHRGFSRDSSAMRWPVECYIDRTWLGRAAIYARTWREGDRFSPVNMKGSRKVSDIFIDAKVPKAQRGRLPLLEARGQLIWVPGCRVSEAAAVRAPESASVRVVLRAMQMHDGDELET